jgi:uncharacterized protein YegJ (DUF2314 family)
MPGGPRTPLAMVHVISAAIAIWGPGIGDSIVVKPFGVVLIAMTPLLWVLSHWTRLALGGTWILAGLTMAATADSWRILPVPLLAIAIASGMWYAYSPIQLALQQAANEDAMLDPKRPPMTSLVMLLRQPRAMNARLLAQYAQAAWGDTYQYSEVDGSTKQESTGLESVAARRVVGNKPSFLITSPAGVFLVNCFDQPYFDDPQALADEVGELRLRTTLEENSAWLSVDLMTPPAEHNERIAAYAPIAKLISELCGADSIALFCPETNQWLPWTPDLEEKLKTGNPLELFQTEASVPVIEVAQDDPRLFEAAKEARSQWPVFVQAFETRSGTASDHFGVKAPITHSNKTEFIWIEVDSIEGTAIRGRLGNDPVDLGTLKLGSMVSVDVNDVQDWAYIQKGEPVGLFSVKAIQQIQSGLKEGNDDETA